MVDGRSSRLLINVWRRRDRLALRHGLAVSATLSGAADVARAVVGIHATDPATVYLSAAARTGWDSPDDLVCGFHSDTTIRMTGMRRTVFVFDIKLAPTILESTARPLAVRDRAAVLRMLEAQLGWDSRQLTEIEDSIVAAVAQRGTATGRDLTEDLPILRTKIGPGRTGTGNGPQQPVGMRIIYNLAMVGRIVRSRPVGGWTSGQHTWTVPASANLATRPTPISVAQARAELLSHYLLRYGPVTLADAKWWTGWTITDTRAALTDVGAVEVDLEGGRTGYVASDDIDDIGCVAGEGLVEPWVALLPALDSTVMGWRERDWYLPAEYLAALCDRSGNIGPTVWAGGQVVGGWAQHPAGHIAVHLFADIGVNAQTAIDALTQRLSSWLGPTRVSPRFHTPLERQLST